MNILKLVKRGCDFSPNDESVKGSDIGNYRVCTDGFTVRGADGNDYHLEIMRADKWQTRKTNKRNGNPLKHPVRELVAACISCVTASYENEDGYCYLNPAIGRSAWNDPRPYTLAGILEVVNRFAAVPYDGIEVV